MTNSDDHHASAQPISGSEDGGVYSSELNAIDQDIHSYFLESPTYSPSSSLRRSVAVTPVALQRRYSIQQLSNHLKRHYVLLKELNYGDQGQLMGGVVEAVSESKQEVISKAKDLKLKKFAIRYISHDHNEIFALLCQE